MAASQTKKPAGYRLGKTCFLFFWPSTDTRDKRLAKLKNLRGIDWVKLVLCSSGRLCRLIGYFVFCTGMYTGSAMAASQTKKPAGYRLGKTCSLFFWPSTDTRGKRRQSHL